VVAHWILSWWMALSRTRENLGSGVDDACPFPFPPYENSVNVAPVLRTGFFPDGRPGAGSGYTPDLVPEYFGLNDMLT